MSKKKTHEEYVDELIQKGIDIEVLEPYAGANTPILHFCNKHNYTWKTRPSDVLRGKGCPKCGGNARKTNEEFINELYAINPDIIPLDKYINTSTKISFKCKIDGTIWTTTPASVLKKSGCPECGKKKIGNALRKTQDEYICELKKVNPNIDVVGQYVNTDTNIIHKCKVCGYEWSARPSNILHGTNCPKCSGHLKRTQESYIDELLKNNPDIDVIEPYIDVKTPILHFCNKHNFTWKVSPESVLNGSGCPECGKEKIGNKLRKSRDEYIKELSIINPNIIVIGDYKNANTPILHKCKKCNYEWNTLPNRLLSGGNCPKCAGQYRRTHEEYVNELSSVNPNIEVLEKFINLTTPILHHCLRHDVYWNQTPYVALSGCGCKECGKEKIHNKNIKSHEQYVQEVKLVNPDIEVVENYKGGHIPIFHRCTLDGYEWLAYPSNVLRGITCPLCNETNGERCVRQWLEKYNIKYVFQNKFDDCYDKYPLPFDFYLPIQNICIEFDGRQHFEPIKWSSSMTDEEALQNFEIVQKHDSIKNKYCEDNNIGMFRIPYFKNVEDELNNFLLN